MRALLPLWSFLAGTASACPVCFGKTVDNAGFVSGLTLGIVVLLLFTFSILGVLAAAVIKIEKARTLSESRAAAR